MKTRSRVTFSLIGAALIVAGVAGMLVRRHWLEGRRLRAVDIPIRLSLGHISTGTFEAGATYLHILELHFGSGTAGIPECLVAARGAPAACDEHVTSLNLKWALYNQGQLVRERTISNPECYRAEDIVCSIGSFQARRGQFYSADIEILSDSSGLSRYGPRLVVEPYREFYTDFAASYGLMKVIAILAITIGLLLIAYVMFC